MFRRARSVLQRHPAQFAADPAKFASKTSAPEPQAAPVDTGSSVTTEPIARIANDPTRCGPGCACDKRLATVARPFPYPVKVKKGKKYYWCSCGASKTQPYCDGYHKSHNKVFTTQPPRPLSILRS